MNVFRWPVRFDGRYGIHFPFCVHFILSVIAFEPIFYLIVLRTTFKLSLVCCAFVLAYSRSKVWSLKEAEGIIVSVRFASFGPWAGARFLILGTCYNIVEVVLLSASQFLLSTYLAGGSLWHPLASSVGAGQAVVQEHVDKFICIGVEILGRGKSVDTFVVVLQGIPSAE